MMRKSFSPTARKEFLRDSDTGKAITCSMPNCHRKASEIHHCVPVCEGGTDDPSNLLMLCEKCHKAHHMAAGDFKKWGAIGGQKTAATKKSFLNLKQFRGQQGQHKLAVLISSEIDSELGWQS